MDVIYTPTPMPQTSRQSMLSVGDYILFRGMVKAVAGEFFQPGTATLASTGRGLAASIKTISEMSFCTESACKIGFHRNAPSQQDRTTGSRNYISAGFAAMKKGQITGDSGLPNKMGHTLAGILLPLSLFVLFANHRILQ